MPERVETPEPLSYGVSLLRRDGRRGVVMGRESGRLWLLEIDPAARRVEFAPLPIVIAADRRERLQPESLSAAETLDRLLVWDDRPRVYDLPSGGVARELERVPGRAYCLLPDGRSILGLDESEGHTLDLEVPWSGWRETGACHEWEPEPGSPRDVFLDHVDEVVALPAAADDDGTPRLYIAAACYGFVVTHLLRVGRAGLERVPGATRVLGEELLYDPTVLIRPPGQRHLLVRHGYGHGLAALDPASGERHHCRIEGGYGYAFFGYPAACADAPLAWVPTKRGCFLWHIGGTVEPGPDAWLPFALYPDALLYFDRDGLGWRHLG